MADGWRLSREADWRDAVVNQGRDALGFESARNFAAWFGLMTKNHSTTGKNRHGVIKRAGDGVLRAVLVAGAAADRGDATTRKSLLALAERRDRVQASEAGGHPLADKPARIAEKQ